MNRSLVLRIVAGAVLVGGALIALGLLSSISPTPRQPPSGAPVALERASIAIETPPVDGREVGLAPGQLAPNFEFSAFDGSRQRLSDYRGHPLLLNFWATWCGPCRVEMPEMEAVLRERTADRLAVIGVNAGERIGPAQRFLRDVGVEFTAFAYDPNADILGRFSLLGMPTS